MGSSVAVLDWSDIQSLIRLSSHSVPSEDEHYAELEKTRHELIDAILGYLQVWFPGKDMDDDIRRRLLEALEGFATEFEERKGPDWMTARDQGGHISVKEVQDACFRVSGLLRSALDREQAGSRSNGGGSGGVPPGLLTLLAIVSACLALQLSPP